MGAPLTPTQRRVLDFLKEFVERHRFAPTAGEIASRFGIAVKNGFYYHAWPEVWLGGWVAVDPTFHQFPADATHIRFVTGNLDRQSEILKLVGKLRVEILEYK